ncbi:hypothetical protein HanPSC8_Chr13g0548511 [Helianthus annuus]|nr:hypothetical protein HanPSC8_Chr13g0548511 [Helianthus annuus]
MPSLARVVHIFDTSKAGKPYNLKPTLIIARRSIHPRLVLVESWTQMNPCDGSTSYRERYIKKHINALLRKFP